MLDVSKAFDRVKYCKLFAALLERDISPIVLRLLIFMYTNQSLRVKWSNTLFDQFSVMNGVKQGGVLSPILFAVYTNRLLERLQQTGVGCHMGSRFTGALAYADDITLLAPCKAALSILISVCEDYVAEYDIIVNGNKSKSLYFKGRSSTMVPSEVLVNGEIIAISDKIVHLGHTICTKDREDITLAVKNNFWKQFNMFIANFGQLHSFIKMKLFSKFCCNFYGSPLWYLNGAAAQSLCVGWRKSLRSLWRAHPRTHCDVIMTLSDQISLMATLQKRFISFISKCLSSSNSIVNLISHVAIINPLSSAGKNYRSVIGADCELNNRHSIVKWNNSSKEIENIVTILK